MDLFLNSFICMIATIGFCVLFNEKKKNIPPAAVNAGLSWFTFALLDKLNVNTIFALFIASIVMSIYAEIMARRLKTPAAPFLVCGMIPLVPGGGMYYTMYESVLGNTSKSMMMGFNTMAQAFSIALGIFMVYSIFRLIARFKMIKINFKK